MSFRVGILGLGRMGSPICLALIRNGYGPLVFDPDAGRHVPAGATAAASAQDVAVQSDVLITILPGSAELEPAMVGDGVLDALRPGSVWLDLSSLDPRIAVKVSARAAASGVAFVGAPMGGGAEEAGVGQLKFFVGAPSVALEKVRPILETLGTIDHIGDNAADGYVAKLLANLLWFGQVAAVTEALLLGQSLGLSPVALQRTLASSAGASVFIEKHLTALLGGDYLANFGIDRCVEELEILTGLAREAELPFEVSATVTRLHTEALERYGSVDGEMLVAKLLEERAGQTLRR